MTGTHSEGSRAIEDAGTALLKLSSTQPELAESLSKLITAVAIEASRTSRFANALAAAVASASSDDFKPKRTGRRAPGVVDPFAVYAQDGESGLRAQLGELDLEKLRDIVAQHGMDHDRLAMKWKDPSRVIERIVEKVSARSTKGSAFRPAPEVRPAAGDDMADVPSRPLGDGG